MTDEEKARAFRNAAVAGGLILMQVNVHDSRFTFRLSGGPIVVPRAPQKLMVLLALARKIWGEDGEYDELMCATAERARLSSSITEKNIDWDPLDEGDGRVQFSAWLMDQQLLEMVGRLSSQA